MKSVKLPCFYMATKYNKAQHDSSVMAIGVQPASEPCYRNYSGTLFSNVDSCADVIIIIIKYIYIAQNRVYLICNTLLAIPASTYLLPATVCTRGFQTKYPQIEIQRNTSTYCYNFFPSAIRLWNTASWRLPATAGEL